MVKIKKNIYKFRQCLSCVDGWFVEFSRIDVLKEQQKASGASFLCLKLLVKTPNRIRQNSNLQTPKVQQLNFSNNPAAASCTNFL